jgi:hypothetical protein
MKLLSSMILNFGRKRREGRSRKNHASTIPLLLP